MPDLIFPGAPIVGDQYIHKNITYLWTGVYWDAQAVSSGGGAAVGIPDPMLLSDGSALAPTYSFLNEANTGFYRKGTQSLGLAVGGVELAVFTPLGIQLKEDVVITKGLQTVDDIISSSGSMLAGNEIRATNNVYCSTLSLTGSILGCSSLSMSGNLTCSGQINCSSNITGNDLIANGQIYSYGDISGFY